MLSGISHSDLLIEVLMFVSVYLVAGLVWVTVRRKQTPPLPRRQNFRDTPHSANDHSLSRTTKKDTP